MGASWSLFDRDDVLGPLHTDEVLGGAGYSARYVDGRLDSLLPVLADLMQNKGPSPASTIARTFAPAAPWRSFASCSIKA